MALLTTYCGTLESQLQFVELCRASNRHVLAAATLHACGGLYIPLGGLSLSLTTTAATGHGISPEVSPEISRSQAPQITHLPPSHCVEERRKAARAAGMAIGTAARNLPPQLAFAKALHEWDTGERGKVL